ncbi:MAG: hypothetical protein ACXWC0_23815, partial [Burkholderiales bacterium]
MALTVLSKANSLLIFVVIQPSSSFSVTVALRAEESGRSVAQPANAPTSAPATIKQDADFMFIIGPPVNV